MPPAVAIDRRVPTNGSQDNDSQAEVNRQLVLACRNGDKQAYGKLFEAYGQRVYNFCLRITGNPDDASEATQEAFCNFLDRIERLDLNKAMVSGYIFAAARNACIDMAKQRRRMEPSDDLPEDASRTVDLEIDPERSTLQLDRSSAVALANSRLPERHRAVLAMRELEDMSYEEISAALDINGNAVAQLLSRARLRLRDEMRRESLMQPIVSEECERALPLLSLKVDGTLKSKDFAWLNEHLDRCQACQRNLEGIEEAGVTYRGWLPAPFALTWAEVEAASGFIAGTAASGGRLATLWKAVPLSVKTATVVAGLAALIAGGAVSMRESTPTAAPQVPRPTPVSSTHGTTSSETLEQERNRSPQGQSSENESANGANADSIGPSSGLADGTNESNSGSGGSDSPSKTSTPSKDSDTSLTPSEDTSKTLDPTEDDSTTGSGSSGTSGGTSTETPAEDSSGSTCIPGPTPTSPPICS